MIFMIHGFPSFIFSDFLSAGRLNGRSGALGKNVMQILKIHILIEPTVKKLSQVDQICARNEFSPLCEQVWFGAGLENNVGLTPVL